ncbi:hypothetical protein BOX15_Mlig016157g1 [Macrostomum lignano]|uniref:Uncharacterized protein n=1 Tax=Macrostomum lignano TaxID=282301 RepID=A0A267FPH9_9PLAT|nr:hypothetical protein BOX15_Mlig016157g1 [Macrostomum lignano]
MELENHEFGTGSAFELDEQGFNRQDCQLSLLLSAERIVASQTIGDLKAESDPSQNFLRVARAGTLEKVLDYLECGTRIDTSNAVSVFALGLKVLIVFFTGVYRAHSNKYTCLKSLKVHTLGMSCP